MSAEPAPAGRAPAPDPSAPPPRIRLSLRARWTLALLATAIFPGAATGRLDAASRFVLFAYLVVVAGGYCVGFWHRGQTLAMRAWKLRLVDAAGRPPTVRQAFVRYVCAFGLLGPGLAAGLWLGEHPQAALGWLLVAIAIIAFGWSLLDRERRTLYDRLAGTLLVRVRS